MSDLNFSNPFVSKDSNPSVAKAATPSLLEKIKALSIQSTAVSKTALTEKDIIKLVFKYSSGGGGHTAQQMIDLINGAGGLGVVAASAVSFAPTGTIAATNVQTAIAEANTEEQATRLVEDNKKVTAVANIAALRAATSGTLTATLVSLTGYYTSTVTGVPDGGGGLFTYDATDTTTADNGGTVIVDASGRRWKRQYEVLSALMFGAKGDGTTNSSAPVQSAFDTDKKLFFPAGVYIFNVVATTPFQIDGEGTERTQFKPFNYAEAIINYKLANGGASWTYNTIIRGVGFIGGGSSMTGASTLANWRALNNGAGAGVGFTIHHTDPMVYTDPLASFCGFVTFENCYFRYFYKGVQGPSGNLGLSFANVNLASNYYGGYFVQGKGFMPNCKYFHEGEISSNRCGVYIDVQNDGFGGVSFDNVVFEANSLNTRIRLPAGVQVNNPVMFRNCWNEANGLLFPGSPATVTLDSWTGTGAGATVSDQAGIGCTYPYRIECDHAVFDGGFVSGINLLGAEHYCFVKNARVEQVSGYGGYPFRVDDATSKILFENCKGISGFGNFDINCLESGRNYNTSFDDDAPNSGGRVHNLEVRRINTAGGASGLNQDFSTAQNMTYGAGVLGVVTAGGPVGAFNVSNRYNFNSIAGNSFGTITGTTHAATQNIFYAVTFEALVVAGGELNFYVWDGVDQYIFTKVPPKDGGWHCYGGVAKLSANASISLGILTQDAGVVATDFYIARYQIKSFVTLQEAQDFMYSGVYAT